MHGSSLAQQFKNRFWLHWVFVAVLGLSLVAAHGLKLLCAMWDLPGPGIEPVSLHYMADSSRPPGKSWLFLNGLVEMWFTYCKIDPFLVYNSVTFCKFTELCNHSHNSSFRVCSITPERSLYQSPVVIRSCPQATTHLFSASGEHLLQKLLHKYSFILRGLLCRASFT